MAELIIEANAVCRIVELFTRCFPGRFPLLVADSNTWKAAGPCIHRQFVDANIPIEVLVFEDTGRVHPDLEHVHMVERSLESKPSFVPLAIGAGSLNDIVKMACFQRKIPYCCVPTAPSVDGFTSPNAPITFDGFKRTIECVPPKVVVADTAILSAAPLWLIGSGYGDLVAKVTGGADWIIADELGIESIDETVWTFVQEPLRARIAHPDFIMKRNPEAVSGLFSGLVETGNAMVMYGNSRPASGSEHLLSHVWEMGGLSMDGEEVSHGFKVAIGTLVSTAMMELLLASDSRNREMDVISQETLEGYLSRVFNGRVEQVAVEIARNKELNGPRLEERRDRIRDALPSLSIRLQKQLIPFEVLRRMLEQGGCPVEPESVGLDRDSVAFAMRKARIIRSRYTIFDLAYEYGLLEEMIDVIAYSNRYFWR